MQRTRLSLALAALALLLSVPAPAQTERKMMEAAKLPAVQLHAGSGEESIVMAFFLCGVACGGVSASARRRLAFSSSASPSRSFRR